MTHQPPAATMAAGFHDAECAGYLADLALWIALAETTGGPIVALGAGTGRVSLPLAAAGQHWRDTARELLALVQIRAGETEKARATLTELTKDAGVAPAQQQRAQALLDSIGGGGKPAEAATQ